MDRRKSNSAQFIAEQIDRGEKFDRGKKFDREKKISLIAGKNAEITPFFLVTLNARYFDILRTRGSGAHDGIDLALLQTSRLSYGIATTLLS